jgi:hypothetical protein
MLTAKGLSSACYRPFITNPCGPALNWFNEAHALEVGLQGTSEKTL